MIQTLTGTEYLQAEIACKHEKAFEKRNWSERLSHFQFLNLYDEETYKKASNPVGLRAAVSAYFMAREGKPTGYMITLDAPSSGLQLLSLLVSCPTSWQLCGGDQFNCVDAYTTIYLAMDLHEALTRTQVKDAIMTSLYGSTERPEKVFGADLDLFYETMETMCPGAWDLNLSLQELWHKVKGHSYKWTLPDNFHAGIDTKTKEIKNFSFLGQDHKVIVEVDGRPDFHKGLGPNLIHSIDGMVVREMVRRCSFDSQHLTKVIDAMTNGQAFEIEVENKHKMTQTLWDNYLDSGFLSVRILDYLDTRTLSLVDHLTIAMLIQTLPDDAFHVVTVHDCFRAHSNYGNDLRQQYNNVMADINSSEMLSHMCSQIAGRTLKAKKVGTIDRQTILDGNYLLT